MLYEYKIQKVEDANGDERFEIKQLKVANRKWYRRANWITPDRYDLRTACKTLGEAQSAVKKEMEADARSEHKWNKDKIKVIKEYVYTEIPDYIPEEQEEDYCRISEDTI